MGNANMPFHKLDKSVQAKLIAAATEAANKEQRELLGFRYSKLTHPASGASPSNESEEK